MRMRWSETDRADLAACRALLRHGSRSFHAASLLLPPHLRQPASALYAFCRLADDAIDLDASADALALLRHRLERAYAGQPLPIPADRAFAATVRGFGIPRALPEALLEGFAWDRESRTYEDIAGVRAYAARVAGSVGAMMAMLMGARDADVLARACDLGVAMQLSNIARDVGEDARAGRLYLPRRWLREAEIDPDAWLARPVFTPALGGVVARLLAEAELLYKRAEAGIAHLPRGCRPGIAAARLIYAEIGARVARAGHDSVAGRAVVPARRKLALLARSFAPLPGARGPLSLPALAETRFLIEAAIAAPNPALPRRRPRRNLDQQAAWLIDLFVRLEQREQLGRSRG